MIELVCVACMADQGTNRTWLQSSRATDGVIPASPGSSLVTAAATVPVLKPAPVQKGKTCTKTVMDVLGEGKGFSILIKALKATGIAEILDKPSASLALFAPDDTVSIELICAVEDTFSQHSKMIVVQ